MRSLIRSIVVSDARAWASMRCQLWPEADPSELYREALTFFADGELPNARAVFIADDNRPIGFLELSVRPYANGCDSMPVPFIEGWYVAPDSRRRGIGRALMLAGEDWSRERGFAEIGSDTGLSNEESAVAHARCGFEGTERVIYFRKRFTG